jgi:hypothetical protein
MVGFALIGGPLVLTDWVRKRREAVIARQIALTDALDRRFGTIVAPVVTRPLFSPWEIRITVPLHRSAILARMLAAVDEVFSGLEGPNPGSYRILFRVTPDVQRAAGSGSPVGMRLENLAAATGR